MNLLYNCNGFWGKLKTYQRNWYFCISQIGRMWYEILESGIFIFMKPESNNIYEIHIFAQEGIWLFCIQKKEYEFMPGSKQPISTLDSIKVQYKSLLSVACYYSLWKWLRDMMWGFHFYSSGQGTDLWAWKHPAVILAMLARDPNKSPRG